MRPAFCSHCVARFRQSREGEGARAPPPAEGGSDEPGDWRGKLHAYRNLCGFLSQVIPYQDSDLERLYVFLSATSLPSCPAAGAGPPTGSTTRCG